jgi:hypothetical protein
MTREEYSKKKAHEILMRFKDIGLPWHRAKDAAMLHVLLLQEQFIKKHTGNAADRVRAVQAFTKLTKDISDFIGADKTSKQYEQLKFGTGSENE